MKYQEPDETGDEIFVASYGTQEYRNCNITAVSERTPDLSAQLECFMPLQKFWCYQQMKTAVNDMAQSFLKLIIHVSEILYGNPNFYIKTT